MKCARDAFSDAGNPDQRIEVGAGSRAESGDLRGATPAVGRWGEGMLKPFLRPLEPAMR